MKIIKTSELIGPALDWAVMNALNFGNPWKSIPSYSTDWSQGGPVIEQMTHYTMGMDVNGRYYCRDWTSNRTRTADNILVAAMRCYVASKLGDEIEIPEELL